MIGLREKASRLCLLQLGEVDDYSSKYSVLHAQAVESVF